MTALQDQINALVSKVHAENTVIGTAVALISGLRAQVVQLQGLGAQAPVDPAALQALSDAIDAGAAQLNTLTPVTAASTVAATIPSTTVAPTVASS